MAAETSLLSPCNALHGHNLGAGADPENLMLETGTRMGSGHDHGPDQERRFPGAQGSGNVRLHNHAAEIVEQGISETLSYMSFPREHWRCLRTNNPLERLNREVRRRTRVVGAFPDGKSALMLVSARLRHAAGTRWGLRRYMDMRRLKESEKEEMIEPAVA